ncbi:hypothetical protein HYX01_02045 [Candidatus Woesearchaeota archaeon]|nr:hypothetical protein [Candidatus Woesearchaeota archaeon]
MKIIKILVIALSITLLALTAASQISQVSDAITVEEPKACNIIFYDEMKQIFGNCIDYYNYTSCLNTSGASTDCSLNQIQRNFTCVTEEVFIKKNMTECSPLNKFVVSINQGSAIEKKEIDFSSWGVCVNSTENNCLAITCGTLKGGSARNGIFNGCDSGKSCQKFLFCQDKTEILYKASRKDFVQNDPTFHLPSLALKEVGE